MEDVNAEDVKKMLDDNEDVVIVNALPQESFDQKAIPGSVNIPAGSGDFEERAAKLLPELGQKIVVHCSGPKCKASDEAAARLEEMGYKNVMHFPGGIQAWEEAGYGLVGSS